MNAYINSAHEHRVRELISEELGDVAVSISSEVSPLAKEYYRVSTTVIDVLMKLLYRDYTNRVNDSLKTLGFSVAFTYADCRSTLQPADHAMRAPYNLVFGELAAGTIASRHFRQHLLRDVARPARSDWASPRGRRTGSHLRRVPGRPRQRHAIYPGAVGNDRRRRDHRDGEQLP